jgi:hypothetical protein
MNRGKPLHLNLDDAWTGLEGFETADLRAWGPGLRYHGRRSEVEAFYEHVRGRLTDFVLYGSGDFHYLAAVLLRRVSEPVTVVSFDNHPDWDVRPPYWACGGWVNRALEMPLVRSVSVWGCGNFELAYPSLLFANRKAVRSGRIEVHAWEERQPEAVRKRFACVSRGNWRERFSEFVARHAGEAIYVTVDLDCLRAEEAVTNWEAGLFTAEDVAWAVGELRRKARVIGGDVCGARSEQKYARGFQRFAARWDHPKLPPPPTDAEAVNRRALATIWPALCGSQ